MAGYDTQGMEYRKLGHTDLGVSWLGSGTPLGNVYGITDPLEGKRAVHLAIEQGIDLFDSSPHYGLTVAEERSAIAPVFNYVGRPVDWKTMVKPAGARLIR